MKLEHSGDPLMRIGRGCLYRWVCGRSPAAPGSTARQASSHEAAGRGGQRARGAMRVGVRERPGGVAARRGVRRFESDTVIGGAPAKLREHCAPSEIRQQGMSRPPPQATTPTTNAAPTN
jgi:IS30 family transposase